MCVPIIFQYDHSGEHLVNIHTSDLAFDVESVYLVRVDFEGVDGLK